ncbi:MAG TPA: hypothetical protein VGK74_13350 [Symbiobacteriaceae bacterium]|jgi:hypothetical protein
MFSFGGLVRLTEVGARDGLISGELGRYRWEARLTRGPVSYGLDPGTLYKGAGRIARLVLYERIEGTGCSRKVAAFDRGWIFGRKSHLEVVRRVVAYLADR